MPIGEKNQVDFNELLKAKCGLVWQFAIAGAHHTKREFALNSQVLLHGSHQGLTERLGAGQEMSLPAGVRGPAAAAWTSSTKTQPFIHKCTCTHS